MVYFNIVKNKLHKQEICNNRSSTIQIHKQFILNNI